MMEYILRIKNISNNLADIGESVSKRDQILQLLTGLGANYNSIVASLIAWEDNLSLHSIHSILLTHEQWLCLLNTVPTSDLVNANIATSQHKNNSNKTHNNRFNFSQNKNGPRPGRYPFGGRGQGNHVISIDRPCCYLASLVIQVVDRWMDAWSQHIKVLDPVVYTCKKASGQGVRTHPPMVLLAMVKERGISQLAFYQVLRSYQGDPLLLRAKAYISSFGGTVPFINGEEIFYVVMMIIGVSRSIITLRTAVRNHGRWCGCQRSWEVIM